jgi:hypothetical protein
MVTNQTGSALPDEAVTIKNVDTGATRKIPTDGGGHYQASMLRSSVSIQENGSNSSDAPEATRRKP